MDALPLSVLLPCIRHMHRRAPFCITAHRPSERHVFSRSLAPGDPFGERSSWEDPSSGPFGPWAHIDQEAFVNAMDCEEARGVHFGPAWARFPAVCRVAVRQMNRTTTGQTDTSRASGAHEALKTAATAAHDTPQSNASMQLPVMQFAHPVATEDHEEASHATKEACEASQQLAQTPWCISADEHHAREKAERVGRPHYATYEQFAYAELMTHATGAADTEGVDETCMHHDTANSVECEDHDSSWDTCALPRFIQEDGVRVDDNDSQTHMTQPHNGAEETTRSNPNVPHSFSSSSSLYNTDNSKNTVSGDVLHDSEAMGEEVQCALHALGYPHGDVQLPLIDPLNWTTEQIIRFLVVFEPRPGQHDKAPCLATHSYPPLAHSERDSDQCDRVRIMDEAMCEAFRLARVDGAMLLNVVTPPQLFRLMRRWHVRRKELIHNMVSMLQKTKLVQKTHSLELKAALAEMATKGQVRLAEAVRPLHPALIQETILLCFPYSR